MQFEVLEECLGAGRRREAKYRESTGWPRAHPGRRIVDEFLRHREPYFDHTALQILGLPSFHFLSGNDGPLAEDPASEGPVALASAPPEAEPAYE
jgi:hypothetical protein